MPDDRLTAARHYLAEHHRAVLITRRSGGGLQSSPVAVALDDGHAIVSTREGLAKERNVARDPNVSLCAVADAWYGPWVHVDGTAEIVRGDEAVELLVDYYRAISGEHPDWDDYRRAMVADRRVALRITLDHAGPVVGQ